MQNTTEQSPAKTHNHTDSEVSKSIKKSNQIWKKTAIGISSTIVIIGLFAGSLFINVGAQTIGGQIFDGLGLHNQAFAIDKMSKGDQKNLLLYYAQMDLKNPETCGKQSSLVTNYLKELNQFSGISSSTFEILNPDYKDTLNLNASIEGVVDMKNAQTQGNWDVSVKTDIDTIQQIAQELYPDQKLNKTNIGKLELLNQAIAKIDTNGLNLKIDKLLFTQADGKIDLSSNKWYNQSFDLKDEQKTAAKEISTEIAQTIADFRLDTAFEKETVSKYLIAGCKTIDKVEMQAPQTKTFGTGNFAKTTQVRPVKITFKSDAQNILEKELADFGMTISKDAKFKSYLYSLYPTAKSISQKSEKLFGTENTDPNKYSQKDYEEGINKFLEELGKPKETTNNSNSSANTTTNFEKALQGIKSTQSTTYYLDLQSLDIYGITNTSEATFEDSFYSEIYKDTAKSPTLEKVLSKGIKSTQEVYDLQFNQKAKSTAEVKETTSINDLEKDVLSDEEREFATKLSEKFVNIFNNPQQEPELIEDPTLVEIENVREISQLLDQEV